MVSRLAISVRLKLMVEMLSHGVLVSVAFIIMELQDLASIVIEVNLIVFVMLLSVSFV